MLVGAIVSIVVVLGSLVYYFEYVYAEPFRPDLDLLAYNQQGWLLYNGTASIIKYNVSLVNNYPKPITLVQVAFLGIGMNWTDGKYYEFPNVPYDIYTIHYNFPNVFKPSENLTLNFGPTFHITNPFATGGRPCAITIDAQFQFSKPNATWNNVITFKDSSCSS
jgi:hypothetical protein